MMAHTKSKRRKNECNRLKGESGKIKFIDLRFERGQVVALGKGRRRQDVL